MKKGEVITTTGHKKIVGEIRQPAAAKLEENEIKQSIEDYLDRMKDAGKLNKAARFHSLIDSLSTAKTLPDNYKWREIYAGSREDRY